MKTLKGNGTINLFYLADSGQVNELVKSDGQNWQSGSLNTHNIFPASSSKLAATWSQTTPHVEDPWSLLFVYQDQRDTFQLYNSTQNTWVSSTFPGNPIAASGVSLSTVSVSNYTPQLRLYYQIASGSLVGADWLSSAQFADAGTVAPLLHASHLLSMSSFSDLLLVRNDSAQMTGKSSGWNPNEDQPLGQFAMEAPITSFPIHWVYDNWVPVYGNVTGLPAIIDVLMSGSAGVTAVEWCVRFSISRIVAEQSSSGRIHATPIKGHANHRK